MKLIFVVCLNVVALIGAHTISHIHAVNSGYAGPLSNPHALTDNAFDFTPVFSDNGNTHQYLKLNDIVIDRDISFAMHM